MSPRLIDGQRGVRYGEVLAVFSRDGGIEAEVYGTQLLNDCPQELWDAIDAAAVAEEMGAVVVKKNGPRQWVLDGLGAKEAPLEPVLREFAGLLMRRIAVIQLDEGLAPGPYREVHVDRRAQFFWDAGKPVYELVDPDGTRYVMQALCQGVDPTISLRSLEGLGARLELPRGWRYASRVLNEELVVDTVGHVATVIQDDFENTYTLPN